jgi:hypothetical protein
MLQKILKKQTKKKKKENETGKNKSRKKPWTRVFRLPPLPSLTLGSETILPDRLASSHTHITPTGIP